MARLLCEVKRAFLCALVDYGAGKVVAARGPVLVTQLIRTGAAVCDFFTHLVIANRSTVRNVIYTAASTHGRVTKVIQAHKADYERSAALDTVRSAVLRCSRFVQGVRDV